MMSEVEAKKWRDIEHERLKDLILLLVMLLSVVSWLFMFWMRL